MQSNSTVEFSLICDLKAASNYYGINIDDFNQTQFSTMVTAKQFSDENNSINVTCNGCNEIIGMVVKPKNRFLDLQNINFISTLITTIGLVIFLIYGILNDLEFVTSILYLSLIGLIVWFMIYDIYRIFLGNRIELDTNFPWHNIN